MSALRTCLITGCSQGGVGAALAVAFKDRGYHVFVTARSTTKVPQALCKASNVTVLALDIGSSESIAAVAEVVWKKTDGKLDVLINNAGIGLEMPGLDTPMSEARRLFDVNFFGVLEMIQIFGPMVVHAKGCIVNNSSVGGYAPIPFLSIYQATKAALNQASEVWRLEMAPLGVRVITLVTGGVATKFVENQPTLPLPEKSFFHSIKDIIEQRPDGIPLGTDPSRYAQSVLRHVEGKTTGKVWIGGGAILVRMALWLLPRFLVDQMSLAFKPFAKRLTENHEKRVNT